MESPVSAFEIYKAKTLKNKNKKIRKSRLNTDQTSRPTISVSDLEKLPEDLVKLGAEKLRQQLKKTKRDKKIGKKTTQKKSKPGSIKENGKLNRKPKDDEIGKNRPTANASLPEVALVSSKTQSITKIKTAVSATSSEVPLLIPGNLPRKTKINHIKYYNDVENGSQTSESSGESLEFPPVYTDSREEGLKVLKWMIAPYDPEEFLNRVWEKKPLHIARKKPDYYKHIISTPEIDGILRKENIQFTKNIDITSYVDEKRETHNPEGRAYPHLVWDFYLNGCSIRFLNPQTYLPKLHLVNATMQEFFNSFVGANAYLTPPDSQGFAPHYDDIEAFILQAEGKKLWRIYKPRSENEVLPRVSSKNFDQNEIGEPIMELTLEAGDMLYFPRGYIHQGVTIDGEHSLHVTISMYQKHSWADLFEKLIPAALQMAISENVELRRGLPFDIYDNFGLVNSDVKTPRRIEIEDLIKTLFDSIKDHLPIDDAVDQMNKNYQHDALPPVLNSFERAVTVHGEYDEMIANGKVVNRVEIDLDTRIRLLRKNILRMVSEDKIRLYYHAENSLEYHGHEPTFIEIEEDFAPAIETLITTYPEYVSVENLGIADDSDKLQLADALWGRGLIMTEQPLESIDDD